jgi:hypothetical protein
MADESEEASDIETKRYRLRAFSGRKNSTLHFQPAKRKNFNTEDDPITPEQVNFKGLLLGFN